MSAQQRERERERHLANARAGMGAFIHKHFAHRNDDNGNYLD